MSSERTGPVAERDHLPATCTSHCGRVPHIPVPHLRSGLARQRAPTDPLRCLPRAAHYQEARVLLDDRELDAAVLLAAGASLVVGDGSVRAFTAGQDALGTYAALDHVRLHG